MSGPVARHRALETTARASRLELWVLPVVVAGSLLSALALFATALQTDSWRAAVLGATVLAGPLPYLALALRGARGR